MTRRNYPALLLWLLALVLAGWILTQLPLNDIVSQLELLSWQNWLLWALVNITILYLAVKRWQLQWQALQTPVSLTRLFRLRQAGSAVSFLTPGPHFGGEPLQLYWLTHHFGKSLRSAVAMLGLDRFMETGINIAVLLAGVLILLGTSMLPIHEWLQVSAILAGVLCVMLTAAALILRHPDWLSRCFRFLAKRWRVGGTADSNEDHGESDQVGSKSQIELMQAALSTHQSLLWLALMLSLGGWGALLIELTMLLCFLGLSPSPKDIILIMVGMRLAMLLPVPGGIGTIEASLLWSFNYLGLPASAAVGLIALIRLRDVLVLLIGLGCLWSFHRPGIHNEPVPLAK
ncbi:MAG: hypothetical protein ACI87W_002756 [Halieaceae bacterium]|jgi:uncharacterized protein (TIRG00374 family)